MTNTENFIKQLKRYLIARIPFISVNSIERARVLEAVTKANSDMRLPIFVHTLSKGMYDLSSHNIVN